MEFLANRKHLTQFVLKSAQAAPWSERSEDDGRTEDKKNQSLEKARSRRLSSSPPVSMSSEANSKTDLKTQPTAERNEDTSKVRERGEMITKT